MEIEGLQLNRIDRSEQNWTWLVPQEWYVHVLHAVPYEAWPVDAITALLVQVAHLLLSSMLITSRFRLLMSCHLMRASICY